MSDLFDLSGKVAIVTGSSRGIGLAIAERYAEAGAKVVISSRKQESLDEVATQMKEKGYNDVLPIAAHNGQKDALQNLVAQTVEQFGGLDILVNNAATNPHFGSLLDSDDGMWEKTIQVNIMGNFWLCQAAVPHMKARGRGRIINVASVNGLRPGTFQGIYSMTKAAVISLTKTLAMELASDNILVNAIAPGLVKTYFAQAIWSNDDLMAGVQARTPMQRIGEPDEIAGVAVFLASAAANFVTGQTYVADGGITIPMI